MKFKIAGITMALIVVAAAFGASAYTSGTVERSSNVNVVNDDQGLLALADGTSGNLVFQNSSGALEIDFTQGGAGGANVESHYELGNPSDPTNQSAFNISNLDAESHDITVSYTGVNDSNADANIEFQIYDDAGAHVVTVDDESTSGSLSGAASGATYYVVIVVDTHGLDDTADLSGTLEVSA